MAAHEELQACSLELNDCDKLRFVNFPLDLQVDIRDMVPKLWPKGIQRERNLDSSDDVRCFELKVKGNPWADYSNWKTAGVAETSRLLLGIVGFMHGQGWRVAHSMATMAMADHDALFFERGKLDKQAPAQVHGRGEFCCLAFGAHDTMRLTGGAPEAVEAVGRAVRRHWGKGLTEERFVEGAGTHEFKLGGSPFGSMWNTRYAVDALVLHLMRALKEAGWSVYATVGLRWVAAGAGVRSQVINRWILKKDD